MLDTLLQALQNWSVAMAIREGELLFPWVECAHVLALGVVVGSIALLDLRLMGLLYAERSAGELSAAVLPVTWTAFGLAAVSGALLFCSNATVYGHNAYFQAKIALIGLAGLNMGLYHLYAGRAAGSWQSAAQTPRRARLTGAVSLGLWIAIVACGRWIGFTLNAPG